MDFLTGSFWAFLGISAVVIATPGPDTAITIRNSLLGGRASGLPTALGIATGQAIWALATSAGIVALLVASEPLFLAVKYAGAAYLVVLGLQSLRAAVRPGTPLSGGPKNAPAGPRLEHDRFQLNHAVGPALAPLRCESRADGQSKSDHALAPGVAFRQGVISDLGNPKMAAFFTSLLPQFAPSGDASFAALAALGLLFSLMTLSWLAAYALAIARFGPLFERPAIRRTLDAITGTLLIGLGLRLAAEER